VTDSKSHDLPSGWSFSLGSLFIFVLVAAIGVAAGKQTLAEVSDAVRQLAEINRGGIFQISEFSWTTFLLDEIVGGIGRTLLAPIDAWLALSLIAQSLAQSTQGRAGELPSLERKFAACFERIGRLSLAIVMLGCILVDDVFSPEQFGLEVPDDVFWRMSYVALRRIILVVSIMAGLGWKAAPDAAKPRRSLCRWCIDVAAFPISALLCFLIWTDATLVQHLVLIAILGVEGAAPLKFADPSVPLLPAERIATFSSYASLAASAALVCGLLWWRLAWHWPQRRTVRMTVLGLLTAGWCVQIAFLAWVYPRGMHLLSPRWPEGLLRGEPHVWWTALLLLVLVSAIMSYRAARRTINPGESGSEAGARVARADRAYFHDGWLALALVTAAAVAHNIPLFMSLEWYVDREGCVWLALFAFTLGQWHARWRRRSNGPVEIAWALPRGRFLTTWLAAVLTFGTAAPILGLFSFIVLLGPAIWWRILEPLK
jgi:hypothetical protein